MRISKTVSNTNAQHASGQWSTTWGHKPVPGREITKVYWWWHRSLSVYVIGRLFTWKHCCESTPGPQYNCQALTGPRLQKGWGSLL